MEKKFAVNGAYSLRVKRWLNVHLSITCNKRTWIQFDRRKADKTHTHMRTLIQTYSHAHRSAHIQFKREIETNEKETRPIKLFASQPLVVIDCKHCSLFFRTLYRNLLVSLHRVCAHSSMWMYRFSSSCDAMLSFMLTLASSSFAAESNSSIFCICEIISAQLKLMKSKSNEHRACVCISFFNNV